jgi:3-oxoacyl-[acyl-carrier protein] reductase
MDLHLKNKRVLVQGSSSGLGLAIAKAYAQEGAIVAICSRESQRLETAAKSIPGSVPFVCDLNLPEAGSCLVRQVVEKLGGIDILITNTGGPPKGLFQELKASDWQKGFQGLWMSALESIQEALIKMRENRWGRIIISTSTAAKEPIAGLTVSNSFRAGLLGLMKSLSQEVAAYQITVNSILPGYTRTERISDLKISEEDLVKDIPAKRLGTPEEFAALALFLGSESAAYITGQAIACDGGLIKGL